MSRLDRPRAALLSVGSELLLGDLTDTNSTWLSRRLTEYGVEVVHHLAVGDDLDRLVASVRWLAADVDLLIVGGGLGPTVDDRTREALALAAGVELEHVPALEEELARRYALTHRDMPEQNRRQAWIPVGSDPVPAVGTAPGFHLRPGGALRADVVALPGVPWELKAMFDASVVPLVQELTGGAATVTRVLHVSGRGESDVAEVVEPLLDDVDDIVLSFLARDHGIEVRLTATADDPDAARALTEPVVDAVTAALAGAVVGVDAQDLETVVVAELRNRSSSVATAESVTAGDLAARLGRVPGASTVLAGGIVAYQAGAKRDVLGVPASLLAEHGTVSEQTTAAMARAARDRFSVDHALAVTGVAGPDPAEGLPVGTVFWALARADGEVEVHGRRMPGDRRQIIARAGSAALELLRRRLVDG